MEENIDSIKESKRNEEETLKNVPTENNESKRNEEEVLKNVPTENNESKGNEEEALKNISIETNEKNQSSSINKIIKEDAVNSNNQNINKAVSNEINNKKLEVANLKDIKIKPKKEIPIEKKPFNEFVNDHLFPSLIMEFKDRGFEVEEINLKNTFRPIAGDKCWVIYCELKDICNFWLSFEKDDISSLKSISLCKSNQKPSVIESFLIDEKRITLKLIISRILQRLNGQKLIGIN